MRTAVFPNTRNRGEANQNQNDRTISYCCDPGTVTAETIRKQEKQPQKSPHKQGCNLALTMTDIPNFQFADDDGCH